MNYIDGYLAAFYRLYIPLNLRVLHIGCDDGQVLHSLHPSYGYGVDRHIESIQKARRCHLRYTFAVGDLPQQETQEPFDVIIISAKIVGNLYDVQQFFAALHRYCHERTRIIITWYAWGWRPLFSVSRSLRVWGAGKVDAKADAKADAFENWFSMPDILNMLRLAGFDSVTIDKGLLFPWYIPAISWLLNNVVGSLPGIRALGLLRSVVVRPCKKAFMQQNPSVSVIIPCRNERGNIERAAREVPTMGAWTELIFIEGHSQDNTLEELYRVQKIFSDKYIKVLIQQGKGKRDAVELGFGVAQGDIVMILDADLTVPPPDLMKFYEALVMGHGEFINGSRLVYRMESKAMPRLNFLANHGFSMIFSWLLEQRVTDTLCGTKVLYRSDYERIKQEHGFFGTLDPFGDFDLLFGAARLQLKIIDMPVRYKDRTYGTTQIRRFYHGWLLLRMCVFAALKLKLRW